MIKQPHQKFLGIFIGVFVIVVSVIIYYSSSNTQTTKPSPSISPSLTPGPITVQGTAVCLPHKNTDGPQTMECAFGLQDAKGNYYGLRDTDPTYRNISSLPMNEQVEVEGTLIVQEDSQYQSIGVIEVTSVRTLSSN